MAQDLFKFFTCVDGPDNIFLTPGDTAYTVREGSTLGPIHCMATCNPECTYQWEYNVTGRFELVPFTLVSNQGNTLTVPQIKRNQTGTIRCHVDNHLSQIKKTVDVSINVQCMYYMYLCNRIITEG